MSPNPQPRRPDSSPKQLRRKKRPRQNRWLGNNCKFAIAALLSPDRFLQGGKAATIFGGSADGNADELGQLIASHRASDDSLLLEALEDSLAVAHLDEQEVGG